MGQGDGWRSSVVGAGGRRQNGGYLPGSTRDQVRIESDISRPDSSAVHLFDKELSRYGGV